MMVPAVDQPFSGDNAQLFTSTRIYLIYFKSQKITLLINCIEF